MPKYNPKSLRADALHKVKVKLALRDEEGARKEVEVDVFYHGIPLDKQPDFPKTAEKSGKELNDAVKAQLAFLIHSIPDFGVGEGQEQPADADFFGALDDANITALSEAIGDDLDPNSKPSSSSQPTTGAEGK